MIAWVALLTGLALIGVIMHDAFEVMLLPRRVQRRIRLMRYFFRGTWLTWRAVAKRLPEGRQREPFLGIYGALSMVVLFGLWAVCLINAFGLLQWSLQTLAGVKVVLLDQIYMSGTTFFTLGYGDVLPKTTLSRMVAVGEAGIGLGFWAVVIGYLPVLYQLFSRRESHVIQLDGRAGSPPTAATMICRHAESDGLEKLDGLLWDWESWGAELLDSHLSYPMLAYYRSQHDDHSWLGGLAAVMDACALVLVGVSELKPLQARMTFAMARHVVMEMGRSLHVTPQRNPPDRLSHDDFLRIEKVFETAGVKWNGGAGAEETLAALRATYEPMLYSLADYLLIPLPPWVATAGESADHWEQGSRGVIARRRTISGPSRHFPPRYLSRGRVGALTRSPGGQRLAREGARQEHLHGRGRGIAGLVAVPAEVLPPRLAPGLVGPVLARAERVSSAYPSRTCSSGSSSPRRAM